MLLKDKVAIITGAASGIGKATAITFGREGAKVMCADVNADGAEAVARQIADTGGEAASVKVDVVVEAEVQRMIQDTVARWGRLDVIYNNAGIGVGNPVTQVSIEEWDRIIDINLRGVSFGTKYAILEMLKTGGGSIVNTASDAGLMGTPMLSAYCASKGGVVMFTKATAVEWARLGIRINCVCPGVIRTPILDPMLQMAKAGGISEDQMWARMGRAHPIGRVGNPEEVAEAVTWLASDRASFVTGVALPVDGGLAGGMAPNDSPFGGE
ncbi:MAG TPA: glucose 1-dehydrogenase [Dehalococcoidia bacterium]|jgi:NAD(P)-dependent dehydrogenase (short-subunit alcohol dehydrogenase family)